MRILVTNDDGVESPGIARLAEDLGELGTVTMVAPDGDRSSISHRVSFHDPVRITEVPGRTVPTFACSGTPADCVVLGVYELCGGIPDLVVSGINRGANLGDDINYSGTVAAAIEGTIMGIRSLAVSLAGPWPAFSAVYHWESASGLVLQLLRRKGDLPKTSFLNVNVPNLPAADIRGIRVTQQGRKRYEDRLVRGVDEQGAAFYRITGRFDMRRAGTQTDLEAIREGYASITPISIDRTDHSLLEPLRTELETPSLSSRA